MAAEISGRVREIADARNLPESEVFERAEQVALARDRRLQAGAASRTDYSPIAPPKITYRITEQPVVQQPVLCFDRDKTVDVRPPERERAVPLA